MPFKLCNSTPLDHRGGKCSDTSPAEPVIASVDDLAIPDVSDKEWDAFQAALKDD